MRTVALSVAISVGATGCAVAAARGPEPGPVRADHRPDCNTGKGGVVVDAADLAGMHPQTLRVYERRGLITPVRTAGRTRMYTDADVALLRRIQELSEAGLNLAGIERERALAPGRVGKGDRGIGGVAEARRIE